MLKRLAFFAGPEGVASHRFSDSCSAADKK
jgi:hypothetical protein